MKTHTPAPRLLKAAGVLCVGLPLLTNCKPDPPAPVRGPSLADSASIQDKSRLYDGLTLDEWRDRIQHLDYQSPARVSAVPGLREIIRDPDAPWFTRRQAALTLGRIGEPAAPAINDLIALLKHPVDPVETTPPLWALKALSLFGPLAVDAASPASNILRDERQTMMLRLTATETLARIGIASSLAVQSLIDGGAGRLETATGTDQLELRVACIEALQLSAPPAAVPMLMAACEDSAERIRHAAAATLGWLGVRDEPAAELLASMVVFDDTPVVRETAARALAKLGERGTVMLERLLAHDDVEVQLLAIDAAGRVAFDQRTMAAAVRPLFNSGDALVSARALDAWWTLTRDSVPILTPLVVLLESDDRASRKSASDTLLRMGRKATPAQAALERILRDGTPPSRTAAKRVLRSLATPPSPQPSVKRNPLLHGPALGCIRSLVAAPASVFHPLPRGGGSDFDSAGARCARNVGILSD